jgi:hypothetical protein
MPGERPRERARRFELRGEQMASTWPWLALAVFVGFVIGISVANRKGSRKGANPVVASTPTPTIYELKRSLANDRSLLFRVLRRELANWMFLRNPDQYCMVFRNAHLAATEIRAASRSHQEKEFGILCERYPYYADFDIFDRSEPSYTAALRNDAESEAARQLLAFPAPVGWAIWRKFEVLDFFVAQDAIAGRARDNRTIAALGCIKADILRFGFGDA